MKLLVFLLLLVALVALASCHNKNKSKGTKEERKLFREWMKKHNKKYPNHAAEEAAFEKLLKSHRAVEEHNKLHDQKKVKFRRGLWEHSDLTPEERRKRLGGGIKPQDVSNRKTRQAEPAYKPGPDYVNWVEQGLVGPVLNQDPCGSCWAFGVAGVMEAVLRKKNGTTTQVSPQQLVDCATNGGSIKGCNGGWPYAALGYIKDNGITSLEEYPYVGYERNTCDYTSAEKVASVDSYFQAQPLGDENMYKDIVATVGPVVTNICLNDDVHDYKSGVFYTENCCAQQDYHAPLVVGYGTDPEGGDYWLIKNSWGPTWGEGGYMKMARNNNNMCEVGNFATYGLSN